MCIFTILAVKKIHWNIIVCIKMYLLIISQHKQQSMECKLLLIMIIALIIETF